MYVPRKLGGDLMVNAQQIHHNHKYNRHSGSSRSQHHYSLSSRHRSYLPKMKNSSVTSPRRTTHKHSNSETLSSSGSNVETEKLTNTVRGGSRSVAEEKPITRRSVAPDEIEIHVHDQTNKKNKKFVCKKEILLREMKYFESYFTNTKYNFEDIDISVHCDVNIFQWLMEYVKGDKESRPTIQLNWAVSILISSDFLKMGRLVEETLQFVHNHLQEIILLPIDLECISQKLLYKLCKLFSVEELDQVKDKKDKIISKLYVLKLEELLKKRKNGNNTIVRCKNCGAIFCKEFYDSLICKKSKLYISFHGKIISKHEIDYNWDINSYFLKLYRNKVNYRKIYWHVWGLLHRFYCSRCESNFPATELEFCSYHPKDSIFKPFANVGVYPCCNRKTYRFDSSQIEKTGCRPRPHLVEVVLGGPSNMPNSTKKRRTSSEEDKVLLMMKKKWIATPYHQKDTLLIRELVSSSTSTTTTDDNKKKKADDHSEDDTSDDDGHSTSSATSQRKGVYYNRSSRNRGHYRRGVKATHTQNKKSSSSNVRKKNEFYRVKDLCNYVKYDRYSQNMKNNSHHLRRLLDQLTDHQPKEEERMIRSPTTTTTSRGGSKKKGRISKYQQQQEKQKQLQQQQQLKKGMSYSDYKDDMSVSCIRIMRSGKGGHGGSGRRKGKRSNNDDGGGGGKITQNRKRFYDLDQQRYNDFETIKAITDLSIITARIDYSTAPSSSSSGAGSGGYAGYTSLTSSSSSNNDGSNNNDESNHHSSSSKKNTGGAGSTGRRKGARTRKGSGRKYNYRR